MPKLLLISFHYRPLGAVASERARAWAENLSKNGWEVDVLTHHWEQRGGKWMIPNNGTEIEEQIPTLRIIRLGAEDPKELPSNSVLRKLKILRDWLSGRFDPLPLAEVGHNSMMKWVNTNLKKDSYDVMLGIYSPHNHLRFCHEVHERTGIPFVMDFRDLWDNMLVRSDYQPKGIDALRHKLILRHWKKWLRKSSGLTAATDTFSSYLKKSFGKECITLYSGFEAARLEQKAEDNKKFEILYTGSLYNHQHYKSAVAGLKLFLDTQKEEDISVSFHGIYREGPSNGAAAYTNDVAKYIQKELNDDRVFTGPRISYLTIRELQSSAEVLMLPTHSGVNGIIPGKLFEYMGNKTRILAIPPDQLAIARILEESGTGICVESPEEFAETLKSWYLEWKAGGPLQPLHPIEKRMKYSQSEQAKLLSEFIKNSTGIA